MYLYTHLSLSFHSDHQPGANIATLDVTSRYTPNKPLEALKCYGTSSIEHPAVLMITTERGSSYCGGAVTGLNVPKREFECKSPAEVREMLPSGKDIAAFQCRNPIHKAHYELFTRALEDKLLRPGAQVCKLASPSIYHMRTHSFTCSYNK